MSPLHDMWPFLAAMAVLLGISAFFSASEAALFSLHRRDRRALQAGNRSQRLAASLLADPERLLTTVLFWNLLTNLTFFTVASMASLRLQRSHQLGQSAAAVFAMLSLLAIIFFSEMLPKSVAVLTSRSLASLFGLPLAAAVRLFDPLMPALRLVNLLSRRLIWPGFRAEPSLEVSDLQRAIQRSTADATLVEQEQAALRNIVLLSDIRADEWMRPRTQYRSFRPPVAWADLQGQLPPSGYLLVSEPDSEEIASAIALKELSDAPQEHLEHYAEPVIYVPWSARLSSVLQQLRERERQVAAVVNEYGESIGVLTFDDILDAVFTAHPSRSSRLLDRKAIQLVRPGVWHVTGMTSLRRLGRFFEVDLPASKSVTVRGVVQETLQRVARQGDQCRWGPLQFRVLEAPQRGLMLVELTLQRGEPA